MSGYRSEEFYIKKYGKVDGKERYKNVLKERHHRESSLKSGRRIDNNKPKILTEHDIVNGNAIKCKECGLITSRLQWTHFKYKCNIDTIQDYKLKYPNELLVAPNLNEKTKITLTNLIELYGEDEGNKRWSEYCDKQAKTNTFEYKLQKYGWTKEEFNEYNKSRSVTLENLVNRHGEKDGLIKWGEYCERQKYTCSLEYFIKEYGENEGDRKYFDFCKKRNFDNNKVSLLETEIFKTLSKFISIEPQIGFIKNHYFKPFDMGNHTHKKLIEVYGTYWHCDPRFYNEDYFHIQKNQTAKEIRSRDQSKRTYALNQGYEVYIIWEIDWNHNQQEVIDNVIKWWNDELDYR